MLYQTDLLPKTTVFQFQLKVWKENNILLGLVHPKNHDSEIVEPITKEYIRWLYDTNEKNVLSTICCRRTSIRCYYFKKLITYISFLKIHRE